MRRCRQTRPKVKRPDPAPERPFRSWGTAVAPKGQKPVQGRHGPVFSGSDVECFAWAPNELVTGEMKRWRCAREGGKA